MNNNYLASEVKTTQGNYRVIVGKDILGEMKSELEYAGLKGKKCFLIADKSMFPKNTKRLHESLESQGFITNSFSIEFSESLKNYDTVNKIYNWLADMKAERKDFILSFGGGVTGDIVGFVASSYLRGMPFIQVPTTLAAMTDASIGGKVAYNLEHGKNLVGAFYQPKLVFEELNFLSSLPEREKISGWAEAIKHSIILDKNLFEDFKLNRDKIYNLDNVYSAEILKRSVKIKGDIVSQDEFETGEERIKLNYGHTVGHAIEKVSNFNSYLHGEAVSIGMMVAIKISEKIGMIDKSSEIEQKAILENYNLPTFAKNLDKSKIFEAIKMDKKNVDGKVKWVLLNSIGKAQIVRGVDESIVKEAISEVIL
ncbi:MAG: 3-dehydroquinate synthase [Chloroflexi bacterium]|jgi:3-dehydroquinate synthase|nr:MAG: 3-dehydroquinate synthase [SAR202 cluster bacterium]MAX12337.1 3-dehydroquinate synthase [Chloroflexota bacterium]|tara:strand:- start:8774 stop:9877 length:1104 start_codon:yes stop_codon:yes gene_type:complete